MRHEPDFWDAIRRIREQDDRFSQEAYPFVMEGLEYTLHHIGERRHVSARELLDGLCLYSKERFGVLGVEVMGNWGIRNAFDIGQIVFQLVEAGILARQKSDRLEDFDIEFDLREAIEQRYFD
jgi:uncharacterized repeat protein (TIGR04138 family)